LTSADTIRSVHTQASIHVSLRTSAPCSPCGHYRRFLCFRTGHRASTFLPPFPRRGFATHAFRRSSRLRYYEGSDSCRTSPVRQASPFHLSCLPSIQPPTTLRACTSRFLITPVRTIGPLRFQASPHIQQARRYAPPKRVRYPAGCSFALQLLSTPSRMTRYHPTLGDAVAFGYMYGDFTWHRLTLC
jgi:hypothetical protein